MKAFGWAVSLVVVGACMNGGAPPERALTYVTQYQVPEPIDGLAFDANGDMWMASWHDSGDYYQIHAVDLIHYVGPGDGAELARFTLADHYERATGLAWDGTSLWLHYGVGPSDDHVIEQIDPSDGSVVKTMAVPSEACDLGWRGADLVLGGNDNHVFVMAPAHGAIAARYDVPPIMPDTGVTRGVGVIGDEIWFAGDFGATYVLGPGGDIVATAPNVTDRDFSTAPHLATLGGYLLVAEGRAIKQYAIAP